MSKHESSTIELRTVLIVFLLIAAAGITVTAVSGDGGPAEASPESVAVTAGAQNQAPYDGGVTTLEFAESNASAFPTDENTATLTLPEDSGVRFDTTHSNVTASGSNVSAEFEAVHDRTIEITVSEVSDDQSETITLEGVRFVVQPDAENATATWSFGQASATTTVEPERLDLDLWGTTTFARGADQQPDDGLRLTISAPDQRSDELHQAYERLVVRIPVEHRDAISFDTSNEPRITSQQSACEPDVLGAYNRSIEQHEFSFEAQCDLRPGRSYTIDDVFFDSPGASLTERAEEEVSLELEAAPVDNIDRVNTSSNDQIDVVAPNVSVDGNVSTFTPGATSATGSKHIQVTITDPHGGLIADESTIEISFEETGIVGFDPGQEPTVNQTNDSQNFDASVANVTADSIVLDVSGESQAGEGIVLVGENDCGLLFDVLSNESKGTNLTVTTNATESGTLGDSPGDDVVQRTDGGVQVDTGSTPKVRLANDAPTWIERGSDRASGNESVALQVTDPDGEAIKNDTTVGIAIPDASEVEFDTPQGDDLEVVSSGSLDAEVADVSADEITLDVVGDSSSGDSITLRHADGNGLRFDVPDSVSSGSVGLDVTTENEFGVESAQSTNPAVKVVEPIADVVLENGGPTTIEARETQTAGSESIVVNVSDDVGGAVAADSTIEIAFEADVGVTFDRTQDLTVEQAESAQTFDAEVVEIDADSVQLNVVGESEGGESIRLVRAGDDDGIRFNVSADAEDGAVGFDVTTDNGERTVTQTITPAVSVDVADDGETDTGGGGGGGGGGAAPAPSAEMNVTDVSLSTTEVEAGETVDVEVTVANEGDADGTHEVRVKANAVTVAAESVEVAQGESARVTVPVTFTVPGERRIAVDGVDGGTVVVAEVEPDPVPSEAVTTDAQPLIDRDTDEPGVRVDFDEDVTVESITFGDASNGTVTVADLESLPADVPETPGPLVRGMVLEVPDELENESATIRLVLSESEIEDADRIRLGRYHDGEWQVLDPSNVSQSGGELAYEFETPGFSTFAVFAQDTENRQTTETPVSTPDSTSTPTDDGSGTEQAGFKAFGVVALVIVAAIAVLLAVAGARIYKQNER